MKRFEVVLEFDVNFFVLFVHFDDWGFKRFIRWCDWHRDRLSHIGGLDELYPIHL